MTSQQGAILFQDMGWWHWRHRGRVAGPFASRAAAWSDAKAIVRKAAMTQKNERIGLAMTKGNRFNLSTRPVGFKSLSF